MQTANHRQRVLRSKSTLLQLLVGLVLLAVPAEPATQAGGDSVQVAVGRSRHVPAPWPVKGVSLTDPGVADVEVLTPKLLLVSGKAAGVTDLVLWSEDGDTLDVRVEVAADRSRIATELGAMFPNADLRLAESDEVLVVSGMLSRAEQAEQLRAYLEALDVPYVDTTTIPGPQQVHVKVRMAEVSRESLRSLGVNALYRGGNTFAGQTVGSSSGGAVNPINVGPPGGALLDDFPFAFNSPVNVSPAVTLFGGIDSELAVYVQALEENQYLRILAEPNLVALSGEEASFLAGGEFPIPVVQGGAGAGAGTSVTIEYKSFGVGLKFRPVVLGDAVIRLQVASEVSDLTDFGAVEIQSFRVPALVTRRAETTLELGSGQTFAMAGLIQESTNAQVSRIPGLGSLPILGTLFRSSRYKTGETELVVLVTVSLVEPLSQITFPPLPGTDHLPPNDWEFYLGGKLEGGVPPRLDPEDAEWLRSLGLHQLSGPGAWAVHDDEARIARPDSPRKDR